MKINNPNLLSTESTGVARSNGVESTAPGKRSGGNQAIGGEAGDNVHLSELVKHLRALDTNSPDRQDHIQRLAQAHASGTYKVDTEATAAGIIKDAQAG